jgi:hypothetical protein
MDEFPPVEAFTDQVVGKGQQPPLHQHQPSGELRRVGDVESGGVVRHLGHGEGWVPVSRQRAVAVVGDPPRPPQHAQVEDEEGLRVATGDQDGEERRHGDDGEGYPEEGQDDVVRDEQEPLHEPHPATQWLLEPTTNQDWMSPGQRVYLGHDPLDSLKLSQPGPIGSGNAGRRLAGCERTVTNWSARPGAGRAARRRLLPHRRHPWGRARWRRPVP